VTAFELSYDYRCPFAKNIHCTCECIRRAPTSALTRALDHEPGFTGRRRPRRMGRHPPTTRTSSPSPRASRCGDRQLDKFLAAHEASFDARPTRNPTGHPRRDRHGSHAGRSTLEMLRLDLAQRPPNTNHCENFRRSSKSKPRRATFVWETTRRRALHDSSATTPKRPISLIESLVYPNDGSKSAVKRASSTRVLPNELPRRKILENRKYGHCARGRKDCERRHPSRK